MPALAADQVTLEEVLQVRGEPLTEQQLWCLLCLSSEALQDIFSDGECFLNVCFNFQVLCSYTVEKLFIKSECIDKQVYTEVCNFFASWKESAEKSFEFLMVTVNT